MVVVVVVVVVGVLVVCTDVFFGCILPLIFLSFYRIS